MHLGDFESAQRALRFGVTTARKGLEADIVIVGDNPLSSIEALKDIRIIVNDGKVVLNKVVQ